MPRSLIVELVDKGTDMLLIDSMPDSPYTEEMMNYAYLSLENQMKFPREHTLTVYFRHRIREKILVYKLIASCKMNYFLRFSEVLSKEHLTRLVEGIVVFFSTVLTYYVTSSLGPFKLPVSLIVGFLGLFIIYELDKYGILNRPLKDVKLQKEGFKEMRPEDKSQLMKKYQNEIAKTKYSLFYHDKYIQSFLIFENYSNLKFRIFSNFDQNYGESKNPFIHRYSEDDSYENHQGFKNEDINRYKYRTGIELGNNEQSVWITGLSLERSENGFYSIKILLRETTYIPKFVLNWHLDFKFCWEQDYPVKIVIEKLMELAKVPALNKFELQYLQTIPSNCGVNISIVTSDNKYVITRRSRKEATNRFKFQHGVSGSLDSEDFKKENGEENGVFNGAYREMKYEMGIEKKDIDGEIKFVGIVNDIEHNMIDFYFICKTTLGLEKLKENYKRMRSEEYWEFESVMGFDWEEVAKLEGRWKLFYYQNQNNMTTQLLISIALFSKYYEKNREI